MRRRQEVCGKIDEGTALIQCSSEIPSAGKITEVLLPLTTRFWIVKSYVKLFSMNNRQQVKQTSNLA